MYSLQLGLQECYFKIVQNRPEIVQRFQQYLVKHLAGGRKKRIQQNKDKINIINHWNVLCSKVATCPLLLRFSKAVENCFSNLASKFYLFHSNLASKLFANNRRCIFQICIELL